MRKQIILTLLLTMSLAACAVPIGGASTAPSATGTISPTAAATERATQTPTPEATATATQTPTPEATATPTETATPETFAPMELSTNPDKPGKCTWEDISSGRLAWNVKQNLKPFPSDAVNTGWVNAGGGSLSDLGLKQNSKDAVQLAAICRINDGFMGFTDGRQSYVGVVGVKNIDGTIGEINFLLNDYSTLVWFLKLIQKSNGNGIAIMRELNESQVKQHQDDQYGPMFRLYGTKGEEGVIAAINKLQITGIVPNEMEKMLFIVTAANGY